MKLKLFIALSLLLSTNAFASAPTCSSTYGGYCSYVGMVERIYVNSGNLILVYFDAPMSESEPGKAGMDVTNHTAAAIKINDNPDFAKLFYSTALAAQSSGRRISMHMRGSVSGFPKIDRIWLEK
ncbi:hypothetical protein AB2S62_13545 [Vibrio sp. NTOU-M3]|uniref:hypothetical protein n=1 Tax=Vibrio sp. NTOU-M3 TaxID=3234954 RepID=UPI00349F12FB